MKLSSIKSKYQSSFQWSSKASLQGSVRLVRAIALASGAGIVPVLAQAGFFTMPHYIPQDQYTLGLEPEVMFDRGGSFGMNLRYTHGMSESSNLTGILGTGSGARGFRLGGAMTFDVFPDAGKQPGVGFGGQALLVQRSAGTTMEITGFAYAHKNFTVTSDWIKAAEPFVAIPLGLALGGGRYQAITSLSMGSIFVHNPHLRSVLELTVGLISADTGISGGISYYP